MSIFSFFNKKSDSAHLAKDRLKIILAHDKSNTISWLPELKAELLAVIGKYIKINPEHLTVNHDSQDDIKFLEINVTLPEKEKKHNERCKTS